MERLLIAKALAKYGTSGSGKVKAAEALNISLSTLYNKLKKYRLSGMTCKIFVTR
ncbi:helix-turn-helix domain-containing protein [Desulfovirgula thermocuniculi]|uniref:helix-turn-helix domain-containing protein n=1 Tax=Desulfovirgula thermocuniculi TaxID=348842 RepID=UPI0003F84827|nr:helix-turn-helix domain-containing protein [Desulfovirgula thermocuniculi]